MPRSLETVKTAESYEALEKAYTLRSRTLARAQIRIFQLEEALCDQQTQLEDAIRNAAQQQELVQAREEWAQERSQLFQSIMRRDVELSKVHMDLQTAKQSCANLTTMMEQRFREITYLTKRTIAAEGMRQERDVTEVELADARTRIHDLLASTSWKVTAPMRRLVDALRRLRN